MELGHTEIEILDKLISICLPETRDVEDFLDTAKTGLLIKDNVSVAAEPPKRARLNLRKEVVKQKLVGDMLLDLINDVPERRHELLNAATFFQGIFDKQTAHYLARIREIAEQNEFAPREFSTEKASLEGVVSRDPFIRMDKLTEWCEHAARRVCRVRIGKSPDDDYGTGFLIGKDLVLTCFHVVEKSINKPEKIFAHFDDKSELIALAAGWEIPYSPYSDADLKGETGEPSDKELDFAVLKLAQPVGSDRGYFSVNEYREPREGEPIIIAGHPGPKAPLQNLMFSMAAPGFERLNSNETRMIYKTSTEHGSSGSPVFDRSFRLIGLHHNGGTELSDDRFVNNRGIPIEKVVGHLGKHDWWPDNSPPSKGKQARLESLSHSQVVDLRDEIVDWFSKAPNALREHIIFKLNAGSALSQGKAPSSQAIELVEWADATNNTNRLVQLIIDVGGDIS